MYSFKKYLFIIHVDPIHIQRLQSLTLCKYTTTNKHVICVKNATPVFNIRIYLEMYNGYLLNSTNIHVLDV